MVHNLTKWRIEVRLKTSIPPQPCQKKLFLVPCLCGMKLATTIYRYTLVVEGVFFPKCTGYSQCIYQIAPVIVSALVYVPVIVSALVNTLIIVSALNCFYQSAPVIVSALKAQHDFFQY